MSDNDDIERLLREIDAVNQPPQPAGTPAQVPAKKGSAEVSETKSGASKQVSALVVSGVIGAVVAVVCFFIPLAPSVWPGLGAFVGAWLALVLGRRFVD